MTPDGPIGVKFGWHCSHLFATGLGEKPDKVIIRFEEADLRVAPQGWTLKNRVIQTFGKDIWHSLYSRTQPLHINELCAVKDCPNTCIERILVNIWGSVCEADVCEAHAKEWHGKCVESFPWRKVARAA